MKAWINEAVVEWCERRGIDAGEFVADGIDSWRASDGIHYRLKRFAGGPGQSLYVEVVAPLDDPMPPVWRLSDVQPSSADVSARRPRKARNVRVEDDLWRAAQRKADERGEVLSEVVRAALKRYVARR